MTCQDFKSSKEKAASVDLWIFQLKWKQKRSSDFMEKKFSLSENENFPQITYQDFEWSEKRNISQMNCR